MRCKKGDLVLLLRADYAPCKHFVGQVHTVGELSNAFHASWLFDPPLYEPKSGAPVSWQDKDLLPIRDPGDDAVDETLLWVPSPVKEVA